MSDDECQLAFNTELLEYTKLGAHTIENSSRLLKGANKIGLHIIYKSRLDGTPRSALHHGKTVSRINILCLVAPHFLALESYVSLYYQLLITGGTSDEST